MSRESAQLYLGYRASSVDGELLALSQEDRRRHVYVIGQTGSGKTTFLKACLLQDIHDQSKWRQSVEAAEMSEIETLYRLFLVYKGVSPDEFDAWIAGRS